MNVPENRGGCRRILTGNAQWSGDSDGDQLLTPPERTMEATQAIHHAEKVPPGPSVLV